MTRDDYTYEGTFHDALADAIRDEVADGRLTDAVVLLGDMGIREVHEITEDDMAELRTRGLLAD